MTCRIENWSWMTSPRPNANAHAAPAQVGYRVMRFPRCNGGIPLTTYIAPVMIRHYERLAPSPCGSEKAYWSRSRRQPISNGPRYKESFRGFARAALPFSCALPLISAPWLFWPTRRGSGSPGTWRLRLCKVYSSWLTYHSLQMTGFAPSTHGVGPCDDDYENPKCGCQCWVGSLPADRPIHGWKMHELLILLASIPSSSLVTWESLHCLVS